MILLAETVLQTSGTNDVRQHLQQEQKRLAKLWDAFKKQEDEYKAVEAERDQLWARVQELEKTMSALGPNPERAATRLSHIEKENEHLRREVSQLGARLDENRAAFQAEQERLAKLFKVYEDAEARAEALEQQMEKMKTAAAKAVTKVDFKALPRTLRNHLYQAELALLRQRASKSKGGKGPVEDRPAGKKLKETYGIK